MNSNKSLQPTAVTFTMCAYEIRPRKDKRGRRSDFRCAAIRSALVCRKQTNTLPWTFPPIWNNFVVAGLRRWPRMRTFLVLVCGLALASVRAQQHAATPRPSPHFYVGRNDGNVQQYSKPLSTPSPRNLTTNAKPPPQATTHHASGSYSARAGSTALDKPTFGEKFMMGLKKSPEKSQKAQDAYAAPGSAPQGRSPTPVVRGHGKQGGRKNSGNVSPTPSPR